MKTIKKQEEITFSCIDFKDAIVLLPLMDELVRLINHSRICDLYKSLSDEEKTKYHHPWKNSDIRLPDTGVENIFRVLSNLGFESQSELKKPSKDDLELKNK